MANISGPFTEQKFLGATVADFQTSIGWNDQQSQITIKVYEDYATDDDFILKDSNIYTSTGNSILRNFKIFIRCNICWNHNHADNKD